MPVWVVAQEVVTSVLLEEAEAPAPLAEEVPTAVLLASGRRRGRQGRK